MAYKQVILVRHDLKMPAGKMAAQVAHASVDAVLSSKDSTVKAWRKDGMAKIVLKVKDLKELYKYTQLAKDAGLVTATITDAGKTVFNEPTVTCSAIGPDEQDKIAAIVSELKMM